MSPEFDFAVQYMSPHCPAPATMSHLNDRHLYFWNQNHLLPAPPIKNPFF